MKYIGKNNRGMTLIEVLATLVITAIVAILIFNIIQSSTKQKFLQTREADNLYNVTYALKVITKDIRRSIATIATTSELKLTFPDSEATYFLENGHLKKRAEGKSEVITELGCAQFIAPQSHIILIKLSNTSNCAEGKNTEIHLRKGSP